MVEFLSIYRKDYLWPSAKPFFRHDDTSCTAALPVIPQVKPNELYLPEETLKPVLGPCPKTVVQEFSETDTYLKKLLERNPNLFNVLKKPPLLDPIKKFNFERLTSTYQADYEHKTADDANKFIDELRDEKTGCPLDNSAPKKITCKPKITSHAALMRQRRGVNEYKEELNEENGKLPCGKRHRKVVPVKPKYETKKIPVWSSEYREEISRTGADIMNEIKKEARRQALKNRKKRPEKTCADRMTFT